MLLYKQTILIIVLTLVGIVDSTCIWYGLCGDYNAEDVGKGNVKRACKYDGEPKELIETEGRNMYKEHCKELYEDQGFKTCCSAGQMKELVTNLKMAEPLIGRCPACFSNFAHMFCHLTCAANQSNYATVRQTTQSSDNKTQVAGIAYAVSTTFANELHTSCFDVQGIGVTFLDMSCGEYSGLECTPTRWLQFLGSFALNPYTPINIDFKIIETAQKISFFDLTTYVGIEVEFQPMDLEHKHSCKDSCSCTDCRASCTPNLKPPEPPCEILTMNCYDFAFAVVFAVFLLLFGIFIFFEQYNTMQEETAEISPGSESISRRQRAGAAIESQLQRQFQRWGGVCTTYPGPVIAGSLAVASIFCIGLAFCDEVTTDPVKLWSGPDSQGRKEKEYVDEHFVPFYRTEMLIITRPKQLHKVVEHDNLEKWNYSSVFEKDFMLEMLDLQKNIEKITAKGEDGTVISLQDICYQPLAPQNRNCTIFSVFDFFQNSKDTFLKQRPNPLGWFPATFTYLDHVTSCAKNPFSTSTKAIKESCLGSYGGPIYPYLVFGGFRKVKDTALYNSSTALIVTFVVNNYLDDEKNQLAKDWEKEFILFMKKYTDSNTNTKISYKAEISFEAEIDRVSHNDISTIIISYVIMFLYSTLTLGRYRSAQTLFVDSKIMLGLAGVLAVLLSVVAAVGILCFAGIPISLIVIEVVPFLVLAVGIDNIFILVKTIQKETRQDGETLDTVIARVVGKVGPSMLLTSASESLAFFLGAVTNMPAIKWFALYASLALVINFLLQITCFISLIYLDALREEQSRFDLICCVKIKQKNNQGSILDCSQSKSAYDTVNKNFPHLLMNEWVRPVIIIIFVGYFCANGALTSRVEIGLNQTLPMPRDSYMLDYFKDLETYFAVGPQVYFVVKDGWNYTTRDSQNRVCGVGGCSSDSLMQQISLAALLPAKSFIAKPATSWLDDYLSWLGSSACCRTHTNDSTKFCASTASDTCSACKITDKDEGRPIGDSFLEFLPWFLKDSPSEKCAKAGSALHGKSVDLLGGNVENGKLRIGATRFEAFHTVLKNSSDFINAYEQARIIADNITKSMGGNAEVFPYSFFYVFYEMYGFIWQEAGLNMLYCFIAIFVTTFLFLGLDIHSACVLVLTITMILVDTMGLMYLWDIKMNPIAIVNLIMTIGMSVEFCSHIMHAYSCSRLPTRKQRAQFALEEMGGAVLLGIVFTNLIGTVVLAFAQSKLFQVYYFRLYLSTLVFGAAHGLVFLPVLLSYIGPAVNKAKLDSGGTEAANATPGMVLDETVGEKDANDVQGAESKEVKQVKF